MCVALVCAYTLGQLKPSPGSYLGRISGCELTQQGPERSRSRCELTWGALERSSNAVLRGREELLQRTDAADVFIDRQIYDPYEPERSCLIETRVGNQFGDGGKFVCGNEDTFAAQQCLAYSVGSNGDFSYEQDVIKTFGCEVHTFDPTGNSTEFERLGKESMVSFHPWGLAATSRTMHNDATGLENPLMPLSKIQGVLGHKNRTIDLLKVDCEGCEHESLENIWADVIDGKLDIGQVMVEVHGTSFNDTKKFFEGASRAGFQIFHKERNHIGCDGWSCVEFSLISRKAAREIYERVYC